ncbi:MAG: hypothetical protein NTX55_00360 [Candidatus Parcubacteria bacterium]|nr:hypothetical protein [Candidatus Parcubacteria bacterium]
MANILQLVINARFLWLPVVLILVFWKLWIYYIRASYISRIEWILLEIKLPREITKGPQAMEAALTPFHQPRDGNFVEKYWKGLLRGWFSLEIVSIGGEIHFFVYTQRFYKNLVEAQIYAQYPDVEITEVGDYTKFFGEGFEKDWKFWGTEFKLTAEDAYPIKTYVDYKLHEMATKEEQKTDPMTSFLEFLGSIKAGEQIWFQILIRATKKKWKDEGKKLVDKIMKGKETKDKEGNILAGVLRLTPGERGVIEAIERDVSKFGFDVGIRAIYFAKNEVFNSVNAPSLIGSMKQYNALNLNGFKPVNPTGVDYFRKLQEPGRRAKMFDAYCKRSVFYMPYVRNYFVLNTEELATIFHFPGRVAETPTLGRIEAKKGEAPTNLPI